MSIQTTFAGLELRNPIIVASCSRTNNAASNFAFQEAGAGAIVLKSLFEENIIHQSQSVSESAQHTEAADYAHGYLRSHELSEYIKLIKDSKAQCTKIPIIASVNCISCGEWTEFAKLIEEAGADALELNVMGIITSTDYEDGEFERRHIDIVKRVVDTISIPVIVKLGSMITNPVAMASRLKGCGAAAVVMFNRMYQSNIDINRMEYTPGAILSSADDIALPLRWIGVTSAKVGGLDLALSGGVQNGEDVVKGILAGAAAVEVCSVLYKEGAEWIPTAISTIEEWQSKHGYDAPCSYKGKLNAAGSCENEMLVRTQFLRHFGSLQ
ncbi:MAG: dihydroorotate dehydrogenase-like protein [Rikenellaceae bacterium]